MCTKVHCNFYMTSFDVIVLSLRHRGNGYSYTTMCARLWHYPSKISCQYNKSPYCRMRHILQICHLAIFFHSHYWKEHWDVIGVLTFRPFRRKSQNSSAALHKVLSRTASNTSRNAGSGVLCRRKLHQRRSLAPEWKYTVLIFIPQVLELSGHRVNFHQFFLHSALFWRMDIL
jgi:hypothetical protein